VIQLPDLVVRHLGLVPYEQSWQQMRQFTEQRNPSTPDEIWLLQHHPVFTMGRAAAPEHLLDPAQIPVVQSDRGGQVTYHGPGQAVIYCMIDLKRHGLGVKAWVGLMEQAVISMLACHHIKAENRPDAPGVYVQGSKIASLGVRVQRGCTFHGLAVNVAMDLSPFTRINPCGYPGLEVVDLQGLGVQNANVEATGESVIGLLKELLADKR